MDTIWYLYPNIFTGQPILYTIQPTNGDSTLTPDFSITSIFYEHWQFKDLMELHIINDTIDVVHDLRSYDAAQGLLNRIPMLPWTPQLVPGAYTYNIANGNYLNMGKVIYVTGYIDLTSIITIGSGPLFIHGLPYDYNVVGYVAVDLPLI